MLYGWNYTSLKVFFFCLLFDRELPFLVVRISGHFGCFNNTEKGISKAQVFFYLDSCLKDSMFLINTDILLKLKENEYHIVIKKSFTALLV